MRAPRSFVLHTAAVTLLAVISACQPVSSPARPDDHWRPARITFLTVPDGATVRVNGRELVGTTPLALEPIEPGLSVIEIHREGYEPARLQRYWEPGASERIDTHLIPLATPTPTPEPTTATVSPTAAAISAAIVEPTTPRPTRTRAPTAEPTTTAVGNATVSFISSPPGAAVFLNSRRLHGTTPLEKIELSPGKAKIRFELKNHQPLVIDRTWNGGEEYTVNAELAALTARVSFASTPPGARVMVDDIVVEGVTPIESAVVPAGESRVTFELDNHAVYTVRQTWQPNAEVRVEAELTPLDAIVRFESDPPGATVVISGTELESKTPVGPIPLPPQKAKIEFRLAGHDTITVERDWGPSATDTVLAKLVASPGRVTFESSTPWDSLSIDGEAVVANAGGWLPIAAGRHRVLAVSGPLAAETEFDVPPGGDAVVTLDWEKRRPNPQDFVELPATRATLGSKQLDTSPVRTVDVGEIWVGRREVTVERYRRCVEAKKCAVPDTGEGCNWGVADRGAHPVNCVSAKDAEAYAAWFAERESLPYRLPTDDEWERAARGTSGKTYPWGDDPPGSRCNTCDRSCALDEFRDEAANDSWPQTAPAGAMAYCATPEGILDLVGNVAEWCEAADSFQVRGGSWAQNGIFLDPALSMRRKETDRDPTIGFRLAVSLDDPVPAAADAPVTNSDVMPAATPVSAPPEQPASPSAVTGGGGQL